MQTEQDRPRQLYWILSLALVLRAATFARIDPVALDSAVYFEIARFIQEGKWRDALSYDYPPLYPALIAALSGLGFSLETAGVCVSMASTILVLLPLWSVTRVFAGAAAAAWAAFLWAIHPYAVRLGARALSDGPTALFVALSLWAGLHGLRSARFRSALASGALAGLAYLCRPEGVEPALGITVAYALWTLTGSRAPMQSSTTARSPSSLWIGRLFWTATPLAAFALVAAPYFTFISLEAGTLTFSKKKSPAALMRSLAPEQEMETEYGSAGSTQPAPATIEGADSGRDSSGGRLWSLAYNLYIFQKPFLNGIHLIVLLPVLLAVLYARPHLQPDQITSKNLLSGLSLLHLFVVAGLAAQLGPSYLGGHHTFLMVLYLLPFAGAGLAAAIDRLRAPFPGVKRAIPLLVALLLIVTLPSSVLRRPESGAVYRSAGLWIRNHSRTAPTVITNSAKLAYHAGAFRIPAAGDANRIVDSARKRQADFIAIPASIRKNDFQPYVDAGALEVAAVLSERSENRIYRVVVYRPLPARSPG